MWISLDSIRCQFNWLHGKNALPLLLPTFPSAVVWWMDLSFWRWMNSLNVLLDLRLPSLFHCLPFPILQSSRSSPLISLPEQLSGHSLLMSFPPLVTPFLLMSRLSPSQPVSSRFVYIREPIILRSLDWSSALKAEDKERTRRLRVLCWLTNSMAWLERKFPILARLIQPVLRTIITLSAHLIVWSVALDTSDQSN